MPRFITSLLHSLQKLLPQVSSKNDLTSKSYTHTHKKKRSPSNLTQYQLNTLPSSLSWKRALTPLSHFLPRHQTHPSRRTSGRERFRLMESDARRLNWLSLNFSFIRASCPGAVLTGLPISPGWPGCSSTVGRGSQRFSCPGGKSRCHPYRQGKDGTGVMSAGDKCNFVGVGGDGGRIRLVLLLVLEGGSGGAGVLGHK